MAEKKSSTRSSSPLFGKENFLWMIAGVVVIMIGFLLLAGGKNDDVNVFREEEVYSKMRITVAPIVILLGFCLEIVAIFRKPKA